MAEKKAGKKPVKAKKESESEKEDEVSENEDGSEESGSESEESESEDSESEDSEESEESEDDDESESEDSESESKKEKLIQVTKDFEPRPPTNPLPVGYEDCFGKFHDPDAPECQPKICLERDNCREVMKIRQSENETKKGTKMKKAKKTEGKKATKNVSESESEVEVKTSKKSKKEASESESEKPVKKGKKAASESESEKPKSKDKKKPKPAKGMSDAVKSLLEKSGFEKAGGEIKAKEGEAGVYQGFIDDKRALRITGAGKEEGFTVRVFFNPKDKPSKWGLEKGDFKYVGDATYWNYTGDDMKSLAVQLKAYFKAKAATAKGGSESEK